MTRESKKPETQEKPELSIESFKQSSRRSSIRRSLSKGSSGRKNSSRRSFSIFGLGTGLAVDEEATRTDPENPSTPEVEPPPVPISRLAALNKPEIPILVIGSFAAMINGAILPVFGTLISRVIATFFKPPNELRKDSEFWAGMFVLLGAVSFLALPAQSYFFALAGCKLVRRVRELCFQKVVRMEVSWFDEPENSSGSIGARLSSDAATVRALVGDALGQYVQNATSAIAGIIIAFVASWELAFIILVLIPLIGVNGYVQVKFMKGFSADAKVWNFIF